jgi:hypothetical protein
MLKRNSFYAKSVAWVMLFGMSLAMTGCGGGSAPSTPATPTPSLDTSSKVGGKTKGSGGSLAEGGEITAQERRAAKLKEKNAAAK